MTGKFGELRVLFDEEEALTKRYLDEKAQHALRTYEEQMEAGMGQIKIIDSFAERIRQIQLRPDPLHLLKVGAGALSACQIAEDNVDGKQIQGLLCSTGGAARCLVP